MNSKQILAAGLVLSLIAAGIILKTQPALALECSILPSSICGDVENDSDLEGSGIWKLLLMALRILTAGVGIVAVGALIYAGFLYATAQDNAQQTKTALEMIRNTVIGLLLFMSMFALINFLVPGGVFNASGGRAAPTQPVAPNPPCAPGTRNCME